MNRHPYFQLACQLALILFLGLIANQAGAAPFVPARDAQCVAFSPSGKQVATAISGLADDSFPPRPHPDVRKCAVIAIWDVESGKRLQRLETFGDITKLAFSPDGSLLGYSRLFYTSEGIALHEVRLLNVVSGKTIRTLDRCHAFDFSPDSKSIAVQSRTKGAIYRLDDWSKETLLPLLGGGQAIRFSPGGDILAAVMPMDGQYAIRLCDPTNGKQISQSRKLSEPFYSLDFSQDGMEIASGHSGGNIIVWEVTSLDFHRRLQTGNNAIARPVFSPDGKFLAGICQGTGDVIFWEAAGSTEVQRYTFERGTFKTHLFRDPEDLVRPEKDPSRLAFSPTGDIFAVGCYGGMLRRVEGGTEVKRFEN